ncbi:uncharacterized protein LOC110974396 [Acanthaster planci]|uniref:Uncharacterized protein LOC110974396 n=1 Tax=Acanthaster planci TaxID=133434 RepID=A0A8B7XLJ4_ACAPL|nr:uncharacterized protein LOC110974396 [Acanthaster planci]
MRCRELQAYIFVGALWALLQASSGYSPPVIQNSDGSLGGQYLIKIKAGYDIDAVAKEIEDLIVPDDSKSKVHAEIKHKIKNVVPVIVARLNFKAQEKIQTVAGIEYIEEDGIVKEENLASDKDTKVPKDYGLDRINQLDSGLDGNVTINGDGFGTNIYLLDTGIQDLHRDFECRARHAYDAFGGDGFDTCTGHGTAVAGIIAGSRYGVAKRATMHSLKVIGCEAETGSYENHAVSYVMLGLDWVMRNKVSPCVVVLALSTGGSRVLDEAVKTIHDAGCVVVAAAGRSELAKTDEGQPKFFPVGLGYRAPLPPTTPDPNKVDLDNYIHEACARSPARSPYVVTVAAIGSTDTVPSWSNTGLCVDLFAPGESIYTVNFKNDDDFFYASGTAMAAAYVAGAAAVHIANGVTEVPDILPPQVVNNLVKMKILKDTSTCMVLNAGEGTPNRLLYLQPN